MHQQYPGYSHLAEHVASIVVFSTVKVDLIESVTVKSRLAPIAIAGVALTGCMLRNIGDDIH